VLLQIYPLHKSLGHAKSSHSSLVVSWQQIYNRLMLSLLFTSWQLNWTRLDCTSIIRLHWLTPFWSGLWFLQVQVTLRLTVSQVSKSWYRAPSWGPWPDIYSSSTVMVFFLLGALSHERMGLSFIYAAGPCQRSVCRVLVTVGLL
jgi:hypothetical protein